MKMVYWEVETRSKLAHCLLPRAHAWRVNFSDLLLRLMGHQHIFNIISTITRAYLNQQRLDSVD